MSDIILTEASVIALSWVGTPYKFGGKDRNGIDCSGLVEDVMRKLGILPASSHYNSQMIYDYVRKNKNFYSCKPEHDCILFFRGNSDLIIHTALALNNRLMIEASGYNDVVEINQISRLKYSECIKMLY